MNLSRERILWILVILIVVSYGYLYISSKRYLVRDGFQDKPSAKAASEIYPPPNPVGAPSTNPDATLPAILRPTPPSQLPPPMPTPPMPTPPMPSPPMAAEAVAAEAVEGFWGAGNGPLASDNHGSIVEKENLKTDSAYQKNMHPSPSWYSEPTMVSAAGTPIYPQDRPYVTEPIQELDDYEYNLVFQNEGDRALSTGLRQKLMSQRPMDWAGLPPSSAEFQQGLDRQAQLDAARKEGPKTDQYNSVTGRDMIPPDMGSLEEKERQLLQTYVPTGKGQTTYSAEDANTLINKIYTARGLVPTVAHEEGSNVWQITNTRKVNEPIVYEDEAYAPAATGPTKDLGESTIQVPPAARDMAAATDPYYDSSAPSGRTRTGKWNFQEWTPGLERMFAPTEPRQNWY